VCARSSQKVFNSGRTDNCSVNSLRGELKAGKWWDLLLGARRGGPQLFLGHLTLKKNSGRLAVNTNEDLGFDNPNIDTQFAILPTF
jgi:hypothetical protein